MEYVLISCDNIKQKLVDRGLKIKKIISFDANEFAENGVISVYKFKKEYNNENILIPSFIADDINIEEVYKNLIALGFDNQKIFFIPIEMILGKEELDYTKFFKFEEVTYLNYLEINIIDCCNMNCKGCSHFANIASKEIKSFKQYEKDFKRMKQLIPHIFKIRIMGGEPFLNPELPKYIKMIREIYPYTDLRVVTNGLLLKSIDNNMINCLKNNNVILDISVYPPLHNTIDDIVINLKNKGIKVFLEHINKFKPILLAKKQKYPYKTLNNCVCINLQNGYLAPCPLPFTINYLNDKYNQEFAKKGKLINIYDDITGKKIKEKLKEPFELCNYCAHYRDDLPYFIWEQRKDDYKLDDWVYYKEKKNGFKNL